MRRRRSISARRRRGARLASEALETRQLLAGDLIISEFMARNSTVLRDEDGDYSDWIEIYNQGDQDVALGDWYLTDDTADLDRWSFPNQTLPAGNFLLVRASGKDRATAGGELHTNFKLSGEGEFLALTVDAPLPNDPQHIDIVSQFEVAFPTRAQDVSYGIGQSVTVDYVVDKGDTARYLLPTNGTLGTTWTQNTFNDSSWPPGTNAIGYEQSVPGFTVKDSRSTGQITNIASAEALLNGTGVASTKTVVAPVVNFWDPGGGGSTGNYGNPALFPNDSPSDDNDFAIRATGTIIIPTGGTWTFGTNSDDGLRLRIDGQNVINDDALHGPENRFGQANLAAGPHTLELVFFERGGGAEVELFAAKGSYTTFNVSAFRLVGDVANGGLAVETVPGSAQSSSGYGGLIETDVLQSMYNVTPGAYVRIPFGAVSPGQLQSLTLRMRYDDGYVAYLNGVEVARRNAPSLAVYNSTATTDRRDSDGLLVEDVDISQHIGLLKTSGTNLLAVHALNDVANSGEFLMVAELAEITVNESTPVYFLQPTPGSFNSTPGVQGFLIDEIQLSHPHGFYENSFQLAISAKTAGTTIRYTLNGTEPTAANGTVYTGPLTINKTSTVRARAFKTGMDPSNVETATYLFLDDVVLQSPTGTAPPGFPASTNINGQVLNYGMDPDIVNSATWGPQLEAALKQIPSMSIVMNVDDLLSASTGIYTHAGNHGSAWERPISLELINPDGSTDFQIDAGLRIRGGYSRSGDNPKHAFRFFFRDEYGAGKLNFPLFGDEGVDEFDSVDLRTTQNYSWSFGGDGRNTFLRDVFSRDLQGKLGNPYTRSRHYHLYINGQYWGLYQTQERSEASYAASNFGGDPEDYDVVKSAGPNGGYQNEATDGTMESYQRLANYFYQTGGLSDTKRADYWRVQGMNVDGTRNPSYERLLDVDNLIDYMLITYYTSDADGPGSRFLGGPVNNYFAIFNRENPDGFKFFEHDSEHSLDTGDAAGAGYNMVTPLTTFGSNFVYFNPHWMHERLAQTNSEYRQRFADRVYDVMFNDGLLTAANAKALINSRAAEIDMAIIAESARWGDSKTGTPLTKNNWLTAVNNIRNWIDNRVPIVLGQLRGQGWYPASSPPVFTINGTPSQGGRLDEGDQVSLFTTGSTTYSSIVPAGSTWKYLDNGSNQGTAWRAPGFNDSSWASGLAELGYNDNDEKTVLSYGPDSLNKYRTYYFRKSFNVANAGAYQTLKLRLKRDDGAIVYLNGKAIARSNMPDDPVEYDDFALNSVGGADESTFYEYDVSVADLITGTNVLAVEVHQVSAGSSDLSFDLELLGGTYNTGGTNIYYTLDGSDPRAADGSIRPTAINFNGNPLTLDRTTVMKARVKNGAEWSALNVAEFLVDPPAAAGSLAITEINYNPHAPLKQFGDADLDNDEFEFIELANISNQRIDLTNVSLVMADNGGSMDGIEFRFATQTLEPNARIVVVRNRTAFVSRYGNTVQLAERAGVPAGTGVFDGALSNQGELITLKDASNQIIQQFEYDDDGKWPGRADQGGSTLEVVDPTANYNQPGNWRSSTEFGGSPGTPGLGAVNSIVINELLTHTDLPQIDTIELFNPTSQPINVGGWYLSDSSANYFRYKISTVNSVIPAGGYRVFDENQLGFGFRGQEADDAWLIAADLGGKPLRFVDHVDFGATQNGTAIGRWPNGIGELFPMVSLSFNAANPGPYFDSVVLSELHYNAAEPPAGSAVTRDELDFVEVGNRTGSSVDISHWRLDNAVDFTFPASTVLAGNERLAVVGFDPNAAPAKATAFRQIHGMPAQARLLGPHTGVLDNGGEELLLDRPEDLAQLGLGYVLVDRVDYSDQAPWPLGADGLGESLHRNNPVTYGDFAASWTAADPSPGSAATAANTFPIASDDSYGVSEGGTRNQPAPGVLSNDIDNDGDVLIAQLIVGTSHGQLTLSADGSFVYIHDGGESRSDEFTYQVLDGRGGLATARATINVTAVNDAPVARDDSYSVFEGAQLVIATPGLLANDRDDDGDVLTSQLVTGPVHGTLILLGNGGFSYSHDGSQTLQDQFTYRVSDGQANSSIATVQLNIIPVNNTPIPAGDAYTLDENTTLTVPAPGVLDNDLDVDGDALTATLLAGPLYGTLQLNADGGFVYTHLGGPAPQDSFTYQVADNQGSAATATVTLNIRDVAIPGDFNGDDAVDVQDVDLLSAEIRAGNPDLSYDLSGDGQVNRADLKVMIEDILDTNFGDADLDGYFDSTDLILVFQAGEYEDAITGNSTWAEGDWNADGEFNSNDMIVAFQAGAYEVGAAALAASPRTAASLEDAAVSLDDGRQFATRWQQTAAHVLQHVEQSELPRSARRSRLDAHRVLQLAATRARAFAQQTEWIHRDVESCVKSLVSRGRPAPSPVDLVFAEDTDHRA